MRRRHWGWGNEDEPVGEGAAELAAHLGFGSAEIEQPAPVRLAAPRVEIPRDLAAGPDRAAGRDLAARRGDLDRALHAHGASYLDVVHGLRGEFATAPDVVLRPADEAEVISALEWADTANLAVTPYGGGTSVVGGVDPIPGPRHDGAMSLDLSRLDRVLEVDPVSRAARIQAGATGPAIERQLAEHGMTMRFFPQSFERSTLGGWIATRAGGHFATGPTHIDDLVESVRAITPRGDVWESRRLPGSGAGPSPDRLLLGSEGTLAVITEAWVRIRPRDEPRWSARVELDDFAAGLDLIRAIVQAGLRPSNCRLIEAEEVRLTFAGDRTLLLLGFEGDLTGVETVRRLCPDLVEGGGSGWREAFLRAPYLRDTLVAMGVFAETFETAVTWDGIAPLIEAVKAAIPEGTVTCRITHAYPDGAAPYFTVLAPARRGEEDAQFAAMKAAASDAVLAAGGTITHHHAVGRMHRPWYDRQRPEPFARALGAAKAELDPDARLNPGVLLGP
jgi:alkyldihydroxyacetonephosphate synthase